MKAWASYTMHSNPKMLKPKPVNLNRSPPVRHFSPMCESCKQHACLMLPSFQAMKSMKVMKAKAVRTLPKSGIAAQVAEKTGLKKSEVTQVLSNLADIGAAEVKKTGSF